MRLWGEVKEETHRQGSLQAVGWKLFLAYCQFLPSPEAPVVLVLIMIVVVEIDDMIDFPDREAAEALIELARDKCTTKS